jgi:uncharacterized protein (TIGR03067 family)
MRYSFLAIIALAAVTAAGAKTDDPDKSDLEKMQGDWSSVVYVVDGTTLDDDDAQAYFRTIKGDQYSVFHFNKPLGKGTFKIDATKRPKTIDAWPATAKDKANPMLGIYELEGGRLKFCFAAAGKARPSEFTAKEGSEHTLTVREREKK